MATNLTKKIGFQSGSAATINVEEVFLNVSDEQHAVINQVLFVMRQASFINQANIAAVEVSLQLDVTASILPVEDPRSLAYWYFDGNPLVLIGAANYTYSVGGSSGVIPVGNIPIDSRLYLCAISYSMTGALVSANIRYQKRTLTELERALIAYGAQNI